MWTVFVIAPRPQRGELDDTWVDTRIHWPLTCISIIFNYDVYTSSWNADVLHMPFGRLVGAAPPCSWLQGTFSTIWWYFFSTAQNFATHPDSSELVPPIWVVRPRSFVDHADKSPAFRGCNWWLEITSVSNSWSSQKWGWNSCNYVLKSTVVYTYDIISINIYNYITTVDIVGVLVDLVDSGFQGRWSTRSRRVFMDGA